MRNATTYKMLFEVRIPGENLRSKFSSKCWVDLKILQNYRCMVGKKQHPTPYPQQDPTKKTSQKKKGNHQSTTRFLFGKMGPFFVPIASSPLVAFLSLKKSPWRMWTLHLCEIPPWWLLGNQTFQVWESLALDKKFPKMESTTDEGDEYGSFFCLCLFFLLVVFDFFCPDHVLISKRSYWKGWDFVFMISFH